MNSYIRINGWNAKIQFSSAHVIPEYEKCGRLHGHTYAIHAKIYGKLDEKGIIMDFSFLKEKLKDISKKLDHKVLIPERSSIVKIIKKDGFIKLKFFGKKYVFPIGDCVLLPICSTSAESLSSYILDQLVEMISTQKQVEKIEIGVDEGFGQGAWISKIFKR